MSVKITVEISRQRPNKEPVIDEIVMGLGDYYATGIQDAGLLFKIVKVNIPATEYFEVTEQDGNNGEDHHNGAG